MKGIHAEDASFSFLRSFITSANATSIFVLADENTVHHCYPKILPALPSHQLIQIRSGEENKTLPSCELIWQKLTEAHADRKALLLNLGGGVIGDMGGFAAGCYKRGIRFANIPTTLLAMVDASVGAKCGIDFLGFKNQIGLFHEPEAVIVHTGFLATLPERQLRSGFAEVLKHYLIADKEAFEKLSASRLPFSALYPSDSFWDEWVQKSISIKQHFVAQDPLENHVRKALNFGHTIGHAVESFYLKEVESPLLHGEAVAIGLIAESYLSEKKGLLTKEELKMIADTVLRYLPSEIIPEFYFPKIIALMAQDKKQERGLNQFTLLKGIGSYTIHQSVENEWIRESLIYFNSWRA